MFPLLLLGFMLLMERVEEPLTQIAEERDIEQFLDDASPEELDTFVREGTESALSGSASDWVSAGCAARQHATARADAEPRLALRSAHNGLDCARL